MRSRTAFLPSMCNQMDLLDFYKGCMFYGVIVIKKAKSTWFRTPSRIGIKSQIAITSYTVKQHDR